jgi:hypothetical protein
MILENNQQNTGNDEVREQVVQVARLVFARFGYKKTALDDIAREARKGKSTIYYFFTLNSSFSSTFLTAELSLSSLLMALNGATTISSPAFKPSRISMF